MEFSVDILSEIKECKDLWVVLENRYGHQYVESYHLTSIVSAGNDFFAKFSNIHSADPHDGIHRDNSLSYAYNNFSNVVCTMCLSEKLERYYSSDTYSNIKFFTKNNFKKIWSDSEGGDINDIMHSVKEGLTLKLLIESQDGYFYIVKCHTAEVYKDNKNFSIQTDYDGFPDRLRYFQTIKQLGNQFDELKINSKPEGDNYMSTKFTKTGFFLTSFIFNCDGSLIHRYLLNDKVERSYFDYKKVELWSEV